MKKLMLALASACAIGLSAVAAESTTTWFDAKVSSYTTWPTNNATEFGGTWSNTDSATLVEGDPTMLSIHSDADCELSFTATKTQDVSQVTSATIDTNFAFTPYNSNHLPEIPSDAKAGMIIVTTKEVEDLVTGDECDIYCIGMDEIGKTNTWVKTDYTVEMSDAQYSVLQEIKVVTSKKADKTLTVVYQIGSSENSYTTTVAVPDTEISTVVCRGTGKMSALTGSYTENIVPVTFTLTPDINYTTVTVSTNGTEITKGESGYTVLKGAEVIIVYEADDGKLFKDGSSLKELYKTISASGEISVSGEVDTPTDAKAKIGDAYYLTLQAALVNANAGDTVTLLAETKLDSTITLDKAIDLDLGGNMVTSTCATAFCVTTNVTINCGEGTGSIVGPSNDEKFDSKAVIEVDGVTAKLTLLEVSVKATGSGINGMYGVYVSNGGTLIAGEGMDCPTIEAHFAAIGANNTTSPTTITINGGTFSSAATTETTTGSDWWYYFCAAIYAPGNGMLTINGGNFTGGRYSIASRYANVDQTITINGGSFDSPIFVDDQTGVDTGNRVITKSEDVELEVSSDSADYEWGEAVEGYQTLQKKAEPQGTVLLITDSGATTNKYETLAEAFADVTADATVALTADLEEAAVYEGDVDFTLDLNGQTLSSSTATATLKNNGTGKITIVATNGGTIANTVNAADQGIAVWARSGAITINAGTFTNNSEYEATIYAQNVAVVINGGTFMNASKECQVSTIEYLALRRKTNGTGSITVYGGSFSSDPATGDGVYGGPFVATGYISEPDGELFTVRAPIPATGVTLSESAVELAPEATTNLVATVAPANADVKTTVWTSFDEAVAVVTNGTVTAVAAGTTTIVVSINDYSGNEFVAFCSVTVKTSGPTPAAGSDTKVTPVAGEENTYKLEPTGTSTEVAVDNVKSGDTLVVDATVTAIGVQAGEQSGVTIKVRNSGDTADVPTEAMYGWDGNSFGTALNPDAEVTVGEETIPVTPTTTTSSEGTIAEGAVATKAIPGLTYTLVRDSEVGGTYATTADSAVAETTTVSLKDETGNKPSDKAFYKVQVTK